MDAGKAVSMTTGRETIEWGTSHPLWLRSSASAQVCVRVRVCVGVCLCGYLCGCWSVKGLLDLFLVVNVLTESEVGHMTRLGWKQRTTVRRGEYPSETFPVLFP